MCGIFGAISFKSNFNESDWHKFKQLTDVVSYRGPDDSGYYCSNFNSGTENCAGEFNLFYGHRRLSIIDLSIQGAQPMIKGDLVIIFNGEIYNYLELKSDLLGLGCNFQTNTDTEVILELYQKFGETAFDKLNGMWAFAIFHKVNKTVILSRDRFSKKPLYYFHDNDIFYFSSEIKQLLPLVKKKEVNKVVLLNYLRQGIVDNGNETFFQSIYRLEAKTNLTIDLLACKIKKYQFWDYENVPLVGDIEEQFRFLLEDSIKLCMRSDVPVGCMLSGGLDSSSVSVIAQKMNPTIETFSVISNDRKMSEEPFIDIVVKGNNMKNYKMNFDARHVIDNFNLVLRHQDEPFFNLSVLAGYSILKAVKDKTSIVVLLNGQGGDELLMGYLKYFFFYERDMIKRGEYVKAVTLLLSAIYNRTIFNQFSLGKAKRYIPGLLTKGNPYIIDSGIDFVDTWSFDDMRHRQILDIDKFSIPGLCRYEDRNSTANSLEMRIPFLDFRLVSFCLNLRSEFKIKNGWTKYILRKVMNDLPSSISFRKDKKGFTVPEENFLRNELRSDILQIKDSSFLDDLGIINKREFANYYSRFLSGKGQSTEFTDVTRVYIAEQWAKNHFN